MTDLRQAAQQALEALDSGNPYHQQLAAKVLRTALEQQAEPTCPDCKAAVLYECVACSSNNYPPKQQAEPVAWQPIETAPKDGNAILVMRDIWPGTKSGRAEECNGHNTYVAAWWGDENNGRGAWVCYMDSVCEPQCPIEPTHWMPLPCPPSIAPPQQQAEPVTREGFNAWWDGDYDDSENRFEKDSAAYWAWAGWQAAQRQWVGLTDEDYKGISSGDQVVAMWADRTIKERNGY